MTPRGRPLGAEWRYRVQIEDQRFPFCIACRFSRRRRSASGAMSALNFKTSPRRARWRPAPPASSPAPHRHEMKSGLRPPSSGCSLGWRGCARTTRPSVVRVSSLLADGAVLFPGGPGASSPRRTHGEAGTSSIARRNAAWATNARGSRTVVPSSDCTRSQSTTPLLHRVLYEDKDPRLGRRRLSRELHPSSR
jgi:hypothetical protein